MNEPLRAADLPDVLDAAQVASLLQLNLDYVRKLSREEKIPAHKIPGGRTYRYFKDEVLDWLRGQAAAAPDHQPASDAAPQRDG